MAPRRSNRTSTAQSTQLVEQNKRKRQLATNPEGAKENTNKKPKSDGRPNSAETQKLKKEESAVENVKIEAADGVGVKEGLDVDAEGSDRTMSKDQGNSQPGQAPSKGFVESMGTYKDTDRRHGILEVGEIYFIYRPRVELDEVRSIEDVARLHILLVPKPLHPHDGSVPHRLLLIGRKYLPKTKASGRPDVMYGQVLEAGDSLDQLKTRLGPREYETKTMGNRTIGPARIVGKGHYVLNSSKNNPSPEGSKDMSAVYKTYLAYTLQVPHELGDVQNELNIQHEGAFHLQVKNPGAPSNNPAVRNQPKQKQAQYPPNLKKLFVTKFIPANPPSVLDFPGAELLFVPSKHSLEEDVENKLLKEELRTQVKKEEEEEDFDDAASEAAKKVLNELGMSSSDPKPLEGHWS